MKFVNRLEIKIETFDKCHVITDVNCPLGELYDYATAFKCYVYQRIQEAEAKCRAEEKVEEPPKV